MRTLLLLSLLPGCAEFPDEPVADSGAPEPDLAVAPIPDEGVAPRDARVRPDGPPTPVDVGPAPDADRSACEAPHECAAPLAGGELATGLDAHGVAVAAFGDGFVLVWDGGSDDGRRLRRTPLALDGVTGETTHLNDQRDLELGQDARPAVATRSGAGGDVLGAAWYSARDSAFYRFREYIEAQPLVDRATAPSTAARVAVAATPNRWHLARIQQTGEAGVRDVPSDTVTGGGADEVAIAGGANHAMAVASYDGRLVARAFPDEGPYNSGSIIGIATRTPTAVDVAAVPPEKTRWVAVWSDELGVWGVVLEAAGPLSRPALLDCTPADEVAVAAWADGGLVAMARGDSITTRRFEEMLRGVSEPSTLHMGPNRELDLARHADGVLALTWLDGSTIHYAVGADGCE